MRYEFSARLTVGISMIGYLHTRSHKSCNMKGNEKMFCRVWLVEIGQYRVKVGPFKSAIEASTWKIACDKELVESNTFRRSSVREISRRINLDVDIKVNPDVAEPARVAKEIGFYEERIQRKHIPLFDLQRYFRRLKYLDIFGIVPR